VVAGVPPARTKLADLTGRVDGLTGRVDHMSEEIRELRTAWRGWASGSRTS
jgi:hypothetical protein